MGRATRFCKTSLLWLLLGLPGHQGFSIQGTSIDTLTYRSSQRIVTCVYGQRDSAINDEDDLTKEELALRFTHVLDYYGGQHHDDGEAMSLDNVRLNMLRTRLDDLHLNRCFVAPSSIPEAGLGVFASRNVAAGELITLFPGDALLVWNHRVGDFHKGVGVLFGNHVIDRNATRVSTEKARLYELKIRNTHSIVADALLVEDAAYLGHMINDGSVLLDKSNASRTEYSQTSHDRHNAAFFDMEGCHFSTVATREIRRGQEILVSYGEAYWLSRIEVTQSARKKSIGLQSKGKSELGFGSR